MKDSEENVFKQMDVIANEMEDLFYHLFAPRNQAQTVCKQFWSPLSDVCETAEKLIIKMELAGVKRTDIGIALEGDRLVIRGIRHENAPPAISAYHQMEINYGYFERVFHLRPGVGQADIAASFEDGFLTVSIDKKPPKQSGPVEIEVE